MRQNVDEKILQTSVAIMSLSNNQNLKLGPLIQVRVRTFFFEVFSYKIL